MKLYTVLSVISQITVIVWKLGYLSKDDNKPTALTKALSCRRTTLSMISNLAQVDFSVLKILPLDHNIYNDSEEEKTIITNEKFMRKACLLRYDIDLSTVQ